jgi:hypothetical protein
MYWDDIIMPPLVEQIVNHNKKTLKNWDIIILNKNTIHTYIKEFPKKYKDITIQQKSDWIRLYLIKHYGGIWSDISIIYNDVKKIDELWEKSNAYDYTGFFNGGKLNGIYEIIETWFIMAKKNSKIVTLWLDEYTLAIDEGFLHYKHRILKEGTIINKNNKQPNDIYFIVYYCLQHILQNLKQIPKMYLINSFNSMFFLTKKCGWKNKSCRKKTFNKNKYKLPYIKLTRKDRKYLKLK